MRILNAHNLTNQKKMEKYTLNKAIETMTEIASNPSPMAASLFTAEDVLRILNSIEPEQPYRVHIPNGWRRQFVDTLVDSIYDGDLIDYSSAQFTIRYGNEIELEHCEFDSSELRKQIEYNLDHACDEVNSEIMYQEEREAERQAEALEEANSNNESEANDENNESSN